MAHDKYSYCNNKRTKNKHVRNCTIMIQVKPQMMAWATTAGEVEGKSVASMQTDSQTESYMSETARHAAEDTRLHLQRSLAEELVDMELVDMSSPRRVCQHEFANISSPRWTHQHERAWAFSYMQFQRFVSLSYYLYHSVRWRKKVLLLLLFA